MRRFSFNDILGLQTDRAGSIEGIGGQLAFVNERSSRYNKVHIYALGDRNPCSPANWLIDSPQEVLRLLSDGTQPLKYNIPILNRNSERP